MFKTLLSFFGKGEKRKRAEQHERLEQASRSVDSSAELSKVEDVQFCQSIQCANATRQRMSDFLRK